jgi:hypothetical protein
MCSLFSDPEILAAFIGVLGTLFGALIGGVIGVAGTLMTVRQQAQIADRRDRESRLKAFRAFLIKWRKMLAFEFQTDTEQNVQNYQNNLPEFCREAALVERDVAPGSRQQFANLVNKIGSYTPSTVQHQTRDRNLEILSDIDEMLSLIGPP